MTKRINPDTGYPMSTEKQILQARENLKLVEEQSSYDKSLEFLQKIGADFRTDEEKFHDYMLHNFGQLINLTKAKAELAYKLGEWNVAENNYLKIFSLDILIADKLRIIYLKEKRYRDVSYIMQFTKETTKNLPKVLGNYNQWVYEKFDHNLAEANKKAEKHVSNDRSLIQGEDRIFLAKRADKTTKEILSWEEKYYEN
ncbi:hypothetical protein [Lactobacillus helveticus]|uniref:Uncharacterized protein n=2 Tax=Lactobacillus helveticus TaxID=1587 RepID=A0A6A7K434_LACHE|nr:hypothetical protein [Lactobacillus helveticus]MPW15178.1 hypothetical protein [Lactobacillus helveticus]